MASICVAIKASENCTGRRRFARKKVDAIVSKCFKGIMSDWDDIVYENHCWLRDIRNQNYTKRQNFWKDKKRDF